MSKISFQSNMISHMQFEKENVGQYKITINCEGHISHGQIFYNCIVTPKNKFGQFGKAKSNYAWPDEKKVFDTVEDLFKHRNWENLIKEPN